MRAPTLLTTKKRKILTLSAAALLGLFVAGGVALNRWANTPTGETIHINDTSDSSSPGQPQYQAVRTAYFYTEVPQSWHVQEDVDKVNRNRLHVVTFTPSGVSDQIAITSDLLPADQLDGVADYHLRVSDSAQYAGLTDADFPAGAKAFQRTSGQTEYVVFITHAGRYASIAATGTDTPDHLLALLKRVMQHWTWG